MFKNELIDSSQKIGAVALSYIPLGLASGIGLAGVGFTPLGITLMSVIAFTGSGQFMTSSMVGLGASVSSILTLNLFLSLRMSLMTSSLSQYVRGRSKGFLALFGQTTADETYGVNIFQFENNLDWTQNKALYANVIAYSTWIVSNWLGALIGSAIHIPITIINFFMTAMFISLMLAQFTSRTYIIAGIFSGILSILLKIILKSNMALVFAAIIGSFVGYYLDTYKVRKTGGMDYGR